MSTFKEMLTKITTLSEPQIRIINAILIDYINSQETINITQWQEPKREYHLLDKDQIMEDLEK